MTKIPKFKENNLSSNTIEHKIDASLFEDSTKFKTEALRLINLYEEETVQRPIFTIHLEGRQREIEMIEVCKETLEDFELRFHFHIHCLHSVKATLISKKEKEKSEVAPTSQEESYACKNSNALFQQLKLFDNLPLIKLTVSHKLCLNILKNAISPLEGAPIELTFTKEPNKATLALIAKIEGLKTVTYPPLDDIEAESCEKTLLSLEKRGVEICPLVHDFKQIPLPYSSRVPHLDFTKIVPYEQKPPRPDSSYEMAPSLSSFLKRNEKDRCIRRSSSLSDISLRGHDGSHSFIATPLRSSFKEFGTQLHHAVTNKCEDQPFTLNSNSAESREAHPRKRGGEASALREEAYLHPFPSSDKEMTALYPEVFATQDREGNLLFDAASFIETLKNLSQHEIKYLHIDYDNSRQFLSIARILSESILCNRQSPTVIRVTLTLSPIASSSSTPFSPYSENHMLINELLDIRNLHTLNLKIRDQYILRDLGTTALKRVRWLIIDLSSQDTFFLSTVESIANLKNLKKLILSKSVESSEHLEFIKKELPELEILFTA